mmetsp:Transcript_21929/g.35286  ORF Transcript_21929/g.35286 Transcript_21929/m.35286 type:complete len:104 (-) Transcript_21929:2145-2456(-)
MVCYSLFHTTAIRMASCFFNPPKPLYKSTTLKMQILPRVQLSIIMTKYTTVSGTDQNLQTVLNLLNYGSIRRFNSYVNLCYFLVIVRDCFYGTFYFTQIEPFI